MKKIVRFLFLFAFASLSCNLLAGKPDDPPVEVTDPILGMTVAPSLDGQGRPAAASFTFSSEQPEMVVLVQVGALTNAASLNVAWYQTTEEGDVKLFEHQVEVQAYDRAFSTGLNPGGLLAAGAYKVTATIAGQTQEMEWDVASQSSAVTPVDSSAARGQPPIPGDSGVISNFSANSQSAAGADCKISLGGYGDGELDTDADKVLVFSEEWGCNPNNAVFQVKATVDGPMTFVGAQYHDGTVVFAANPCALSGGSDLPGTKVKFSAHVESREDVPDAGVTITLGDDTLAPRIKVESTPSKGTKVEAGDEIAITVTATEKRAGGPWQTGVQQIQVTADPGGLLGEPLIVEGRLPKACGQKSWEQNYKVTYTVPKNPPPIVTLCAIADDFAGNQNSKCAEFPTGDVWTGTVHSETVGDYGNAGTCINEAWDLQFRVVVGGDGSVKGKGDGHLVLNPICSGPGFLNWDGSDQAKNVQFDVIGRYDGNTFELRFIQTNIDGATWGLYNYSLLLGQAVLEIPRISDTAAEGQPSTNSGEVGGFVGSGYHKVKMVCITCK